MITTWNQFNNIMLIVEMMKTLKQLWTMMLKAIYDHVGLFLPGQPGQTEAKVSLWPKVFEVGH